MLTHKTKFLKVLGEVKALYTPEYNASYGFSVNLIKKLFQYSDLGKALNLGIIVLEETDEDGCYTVVEGIQKLITITLIMYALCECYKQTSSNNEQAITKIYEKYMLGEKGLKIQICNSSQDILEKIIYKEKLVGIEKDNNLFKVLHAFWKEIKAQDFSANELYQIMKSIECYVIKVEKGEGLNFYHLLNKNSTFLNNENIIRYFLKEKYPVCLTIFDDIVDEFTLYRHKDSFEPFLRDFLSIQQTKTPIPYQEIFPYFVAYIDSLSQTMNPEKIMFNIRQYAYIYLKLLTVDFEYFDIKKNVTRINEVDGQRAYSYLMDVIYDYDNGRLTTDALNLTLKSVYEFLKTGQEFDFTLLSKQINEKLARRNML